MTHGCFCARHVFVDDGRVGVDDWGLAHLQGDPLRDLGRYAVDMAGHRLPEVFEGRTRFAAHVRRGVCSGHGGAVGPDAARGATCCSSHSSRLAFTELGHGDASRLSLLQQAVRALPTRT